MQESAREYLTSRIRRSAFLRARVSFLSSPDSAPDRAEEAPDPAPAAERSLSFSASAADTDWRGEGERLAGWTGRGGVAWVGLGLGLGLV